MPDTLAWSSSSTFDVSWAVGVPNPSPISVWTFSIPAITDLGAFPTLVLCCSARATVLVNGDSGFNFGFGADVTVAGATVPEDSSHSEEYENNFGPTGFPDVGDKYSQMKDVIFKRNFAPGASVNVFLNVIGRYQFQGVITVALLRDFFGLDARHGRFRGVAIRRIYPGTATTPDPSPLTAVDMLDPAPAGLVSLYGSDSWSASAPPAVTIENSPGWEDLTTATAMGLRAAIGLYAPQALDPDPSNFITPPPTVTGVTGSQAAEVFHGTEYFANTFIATPLVSIPSKLATIIG